MKNDILATNQFAIEIALGYLAKRNALHKLAIRVPIMGREVCFWSPEGAKRARNARRETMPILSVDRL